MAFEPVLIETLLQFYKGIYNKTISKPVSRLGRLMRRKMFVRQGCCPTSSLKIRTLSVEYVLENLLVLNGPTNHSLFSGRRRYITHEPPRHGSGHWIRDSLECLYDAVSSSSSFQS